MREMLDQTMFRAADAQELKYVTARGTPSWSAPCDVATDSHIVSASWTGPGAARTVQGSPRMRLAEHPSTLHDTLCGTEKIALAR